MLLEFSFRNFGPFAEEQNLSFDKQVNSSQLAANLTVGGKNTVFVKSAGIFGANASGKSSVLNALHCMKGFVIDEESQQLFLPYAFDREIKTSPTLFEVKLMIGEVLYQYGFEVENKSDQPKKIISEYLYVFASSRAQTWLERTWNEEDGSYSWKISPKLGPAASRRTWINTTRADRLFLTNAASLNCTKLAELYLWFKDKLEFIAPSEASRLLTGRIMHDELADPEDKEDFLQLLRAADPTISDFSFIEQKESGQYAAALTRAAQLGNFQTALAAETAVKVKNLEEAAGRLNSQVSLYTVLLSHADRSGRRAVFSPDAESSGTLNFMTLLAYLFRGLRLGRFLVIDEIGRGMHPELTRFLLMLIHSRLNADGAQLLFTSHEANLLRGRDEAADKILRDDQVWFCNKTDAEAELYALDAFGLKERDRIDNEEAYLSGRYRAVPNLPYVDLLVSRLHLGSQNHVG